MTSSPKKGGGRERRKYPRVPLNLLIQFRFDSFEEFMVEYAENISEGGMMVRADDPHPEGSMIYLQFALKDGTRLIEGLGKVVHVNPKGSAHPGMGIEFVSFDDESRELIKAIVDERVKKGEVLG
ncbi:MAG: TIGR02266 family protein [Deltaproteobacteria bacterium]|nr:TIGR02266 family protein [Deltaproteobacteria bacterium]